jgi:hypothetical protein
MVVIMSKEIICPITSKPCDQQNIGDCASQDFDKPGIGLVKGRCEHVFEFAVESNMVGFRRVGDRIEIVNTVNDKNDVQLTSFSKGEKVVGEAVHLDYSVDAYRDIFSELGLETKRSNDF